jgi:hypothetical protein
MNCFESAFVMSNFHSNVRLLIALTSALSKHVMYTEQVQLNEIGTNFKNHVLIPFLTTNYLKAFLSSLGAKSSSACHKKSIVRNGIIIPNLILDCPNGF